MNNLHRISIHIKFYANIVHNSVPKPPKSVKIIDATTDKLTIEIVPGEGRADSFDILLKQRFHSSVVVKKDTSVTITDIKGLEPGTLYQYFTVIAVSNGVNSSQTTVPDSSTSKLYILSFNPVKK